MVIKKSYILWEGCEETKWGMVKIQHEIKMGGGECGTMSTL